MRENLAEKYMAMTAEQINTALFSLHDESSRLNNTIDKMTFENDGTNTEASAEIASKLGRKLRFVNHCILTANKCLGIKNKAQKREDHFNSLNCKYENLKSAAKSVLGREEFEAVWFEFIKIEEAKK